MCSGFAVIPFRIASVRPGRSSVTVDNPTRPYCSCCQISSSPSLKWVRSHSYGVWVVSDWDNTNIETLANRENSYTSSGYPDIRHSYTRRCTPVAVSQDDGSTSSPAVRRPPPRRPESPTDENWSNAVENTPPANSNVPNNGPHPRYHYHFDASC